MSKPTNTLSTQHMGDIRKIFDMIDTERKGHISYTEFGDVVKCFVNVTDGQVVDVIKDMNADTDGNRQIDFEEFCAALQCELDDVDREGELKATFRQFDTHGRGHITAPDIYKVFAQLGDPVSLLEAEEMLSECDQDLNGYMEFRELRRLMEK